MRGPMKTTVEIADGLACEVRALAARERTTVRALIEEGLRAVLRQRQQSGAPFRLREAVFAGAGL